MYVHGRIPLESETHIPLHTEDALMNFGCPHFLALSVAMSIMLQSDNHTRNFYLEYAQELLLYFFMQCKIIFCDTFTVYNVHSLVHLPDDVTFFKCSLNELSAFPFENYLQILKKIVRNAKNPVAQVGKRCAESDRLQIKVPSTHSEVTHVVVSTRDRDSCFMLHTEDYVFVREIREDCRLLCDVIKQRKMDNFYDNP